MNINELTAASVSATSRWMVVLEEGVHHLHVTKETGEYHDEPLWDVSTSQRVDPEYKWTTEGNCLHLVLYRGTSEAAALRFVSEALTGQFNLELVA